MTAGDASAESARRALPTHIKTWSEPCLTNDNGLATHRYMRGFVMD